ncbi:MAG: tRNA (adenosine(37)-N6)-threonylcarbamoyltransferase complex dimerization subunit type 1 TsaB [Myxococcota bacterium]
MTADGPLLAVETATEQASVALWENGAVTDQELVAPGQPAAEVLVPAIDAVLARTGRSLDALSAFAVSIGPGSFTGLRIGLATVKGLAFTQQTPVIPVPTLAALAHAAAPRETCAAVLDARRDEVYTAGFEAGRPADWLPEGVIPIAALAEQLPRGAAVVGEGVGVCAPLLGERRPDLPLVPWEPGSVVAALAALGARGAAAGASVPAAALVPRYVRRAEAEVKRTGDRFEAGAGFPDWL